MVSFARTPVLANENGEPPRQLTLDLGYRYAHGRFSNETGLGPDFHGGGPLLGFRYPVPIGKRFR
jgi:hypothetical protein